LLADGLGCLQENLHGLVDHALGLGIIARAQCSNLWVDIDAHADLNHKVFPSLHAAVVSTGAFWCSRMVREETTLDLLDARLADPEKILRLFGIRIRSIGFSVLIIFGDTLACNQFNELASSDVVQFILYICDLFLVAR
jgi:hypothetical protein